DVRPGDRAFTERLLREGVCVAAIVDDQLAARTFSYCSNDRYADIGAATAPAFRRRGFCVACAALLCRLIRAEGRTPVWSTGESNTASQAVARKLGFKPDES